MIVHAPAKINLSLKILGKRADGYHELETVIATLALSDSLTIDKLERPGELQFSCSEPGVPADDTNLVVQAVHAYRQASGTQDGLSIHLQKNIPHGAGLGGGSSDAAATLQALNRLNDEALEPSHLRELAATLGSDVPFFLAAGPARCTGRGEVVTPLERPLPDWPLLLIKPPFGISTPWAYKAYAGEHNTPPEEEPESFDPQHTDVCSYGGPGSPSSLAQSIDGWELQNDLEPPVFTKYLPLAEIKTWLLEQPKCRAAMMSGSGSTLFAILKNPADAEPLQQRIHQRYGDTFWVMPTTLASA